MDKSQLKLDPKNKSVKNSLKMLAEREYPRILTQFCRDPNNFAYGCADRNWWHYKIRDFPSIILQQAGLTIYMGHSLKFDDDEKLNNLVRASALFWNQRVIRYGAFEEYYPWEKGYPPLAFSTLSIMLIIKEGLIPPGYLYKGIQKASVQLIDRFESQAANQQIAGLAALSFIKRIYPELVPNEKFEIISENSLALQDPEGWFKEYGGPDLGYLSVTIDCLWDLYDATNDEKYVQSAGQALSFIESMINSVGGTIGMHNARNTDYIVPYGITRFLIRKDKYSNKARSIIEKIYNEADSNEHFFASIDDRYWCHYIGASLFRSINIFPDNFELTKSKSKSVNFITFKNSGYILFKTKRGQVLVSTLKGGILSLYNGKVNFSDYGWILGKHSMQLVNHFWSNSWVSTYKKKKDCLEIKVKGPLFINKHLINNPFKHFVLRILSLIIGRHLIQFLKSKLIFKSGFSSSNFIRTIKIKEDKIVIKDKITNSANFNLMRAPRSSKRHVASADTFHQEDLVSQFKYKEKRETTDQYTLITTEYLL